MSKTIFLLASCTMFMLASCSSSHKSQHTVKESSSETEISLKDSVATSADTSTKVAKENSESSREIEVDFVDDPGQPGPVNSGVTEEDYLPNGTKVKTNRRGAIRISPTGEIQFENLAKVKIIEKGRLQRSDSSAGGSFHNVEVKAAEKKTAEKSRTETTKQKKNFRFSWWWLLLLILLSPAVRNKIAKTGRWILLRTFGIKL